MAHNQCLQLDLGEVLDDDDSMSAHGDHNSAPENEEILISNNECDNFNEIVGSLEEIVLSDTFQNSQKDFMDKYYKNFDDCDENKSIYNDIFKEYVTQIGSYVENELKKTMEKGSSFNMQSFLSELPSRQEEIEQELFNILLSFNNFATFKTMFLEYRREQEGTALDFSDMLLVNGQPATPRTSNQTLAQKLGLNFGGPICPGQGAASKHLNLGPTSSNQISASKTNTQQQQQHTDMDIETTPAVQYVNGSPVF